MNETLEVVPVFVQLEGLRLACSGIAELLIAYNVQEAQHAQRKAWESQSFVLLDGMGRLQV